MQDKMTEYGFMNSILEYKNLNHIDTVKLGHSSTCTTSPGSLHSLKSITQRAVFVRFYD